MLMDGCTGSSCSVLYSQAGIAERRAIMHDSVLVRPTLAVSFALPTPYNRFLPSGVKLSAIRNIFKPRTLEQSIAPEVMP
jgi:hypothetical protein